MIQQDVTTDIVIVGGGLAGVCAAIGAARQGSRVALVQNRPVLGGNSSSEVRVWVCGATAHGTQLFARETGLMGELYVENQFRNPDGNPYYWDLLLLEKVRAEGNIDLFLNTEILEVAAEGPAEDRRIASVTGWTSGSETRTIFRAPTFIDCSGDGLVGYLAGADFMTGREPRDRFGESWAPEVPDDDMLGSTILFYSKDVGHPQKFVAPPFALDITTTSIPQHRVIRQDMNGCAFWWIEWGGERDIVHDNERIRDELQSVCYGIWDHIKNSGEFDADDLSLEWIGAVPGKREYRRFVGDHVLTQQDVLRQVEFEDRIGFGGWSIDLHPVGGIYADEHGSRHWHPDGVYHVPLRTLYSRNVGNLWMAGRDISASHVAFGTTRVMATCAVVGEAAGVAAAVASSLGVTPREAARHHLPEVRRALVRADASLMGVADTDPANLALSARVSASSTRTSLASTRSTGCVQLVDDLCLGLPADPGLDGVDVLLDAEEDTELTAGLFRPTKAQNYLPQLHVQSVTVPVPRGRSWVRLPLLWAGTASAADADEGTIGAGSNVFVVLHSNPLVSALRGSAQQAGTVTLIHRELPENERFSEQWRDWKETLHGAGICFRSVAPTSAFDARNVTGGYARPFGGPNMWASASIEADPQPWIRLDWDTPQSVRKLDLILDDDVNEDLINLHHHRTPAEIMPTLVRHARVEVLDAHNEGGPGGDGTWQQIARITDNRRRRVSLDLGTPVTTSVLRIVVEDTNGAEHAHVVSVRAYAN